jgi:hypothetical protein
MSGWPICSARFNGTRGVIALTQAKTASQREDAMRQFNEAIPVHFPMLMADMGGMSEKAFRPWPVRIHIFDVNSKTVLSVGKVSHCAPDLDELSRVLQTHRIRTSL